MYLSTCLLPALLAFELRITQEIVVFILELKIAVTPSLADLVVFCSTVSCLVGAALSLYDFTLHTMSYPFLKKPLHFPSANDRCGM